MYIKWSDVTVFLIWVGHKEKLGAHIEKELAFRNKSRTPKIPITPSIHPYPPIMGGLCWLVDSELLLSVLLTDPQGAHAYQEGVFLIY